MSDLLAVTGGALAFGTLAVTGFVHVRHRRVTEEQLDRQEIVPRSLRAVTAAAVGPCELAIGLVGSATLLAGAPSVVPSALAAALFSLYTAFALVVWRFRPGAPCGCSPADDPASGWTVVRAGALAALAAGPLSEGFAAPELAWTGRSLSLLMAVSMGLVLWHLPLAMGTGESP